MADKEFLNWIADRLVNVYGENENTDYIRYLRQIANGTKPQLADVREQAVLVRQRLEYHFRKTDGGFMVPDNMPFMKEFLGALDALLKKVEHVG